MFKDEVREQENVAMLQYLDELQKQDWEEMKKKKHLQKKLAVSGGCFLMINFSLFKIIG
jgi:hypothetical protein